LSTFFSKSSVVFSLLSAFYRPAALLPYYSVAPLLLLLL
jgi:hypothetical protein